MASKWFLNGYSPRVATSKPGKIVQSEVPKDTIAQVLNIGLLFIGHWFYVCIFYIEFTKYTNKSVENQVFIYLRYMQLLNYFISFNL